MKEKLNSLLMDAMKSKDNVRVGVLRSIKSEFTKFEKEESGKSLDHIQEVKILKKMESAIEDSISQFKKGNRLDLVENEQLSLNVLKTFLPEEPSEEEMKEHTKTVIELYKQTKPNITMADMKSIMEKVKEVYPFINGKIVSMVLKQYI